jgi:hypothetical protein
MKTKIPNREKVFPTEETKIHCMKKVFPMEEMEISDRGNWGFLMENWWYFSEEVTAPSGNSTGE